MENNNEINKETKELQARLEISIRSSNTAHKQINEFRECACQVRCLFERMPMFLEMAATNSDAFAKAKIDRTPWKEMETALIDIKGDTLARVGHALRSTAEYLEKIVSRTDEEIEEIRASLT